MKSFHYLLENFLKCRSMIRNMKQNPRQRTNLYKLSGRAGVSAQIWCQRTVPEWGDKKTWRKRVTSQAWLAFPELTTLSCWMVLSLLERSHCSCFFAFSVSHNFCLKAFPSSLMAVIFRWQKTKSHTQKLFWFWMNSKHTATKHSICQKKIILHPCLLIWSRHSCRTNQTTLFIAWLFWYNVPSPLLSY